MAASPYPSGTMVRVEHLERDHADLKAEVQRGFHEMKERTDLVPVLITEIANLQAEVKWLRYTLIGFIPIMAGVIVAVLRAAGQG